jgi:hypothetical protein
MELCIVDMAPLLIPLTSVALNPTRKLQAPFMGESAICDLPRRRDKLMTELIYQKRSTSL